MGGREDLEDVAAAVAEEVPAVWERLAETAEATAPTGATVLMGHQGKAEASL
jgi:hypothetical protein